MQLDIILIIICIQFLQNENFGVDSLYKSAGNFNGQSAQLRAFLSKLMKAKDDFEWIRQACSSLRNNEENSYNNIPRLVRENMNSKFSFGRNTNNHYLRNEGKLALSQPNTHLDNKRNNNILMKNFQPILNPFHKKSNFQTNRERLLQKWNGSRNLPQKYAHQGQTDSNKVRFNVMNNQMNSYNKYSPDNPSIESINNAPFMQPIPSHVETKYRRPRRLTALHAQANDGYLLDYNLKDKRIKQYLPYKSVRISNGHKYQDLNIKEEIQNHGHSRNTRKIERKVNNNFDDGNNFVLNDIFTSEYKEEPKRHLNSSEKPKLRSLIADDNQEDENTSYEILLGRQFNKKNNNRIRPKVNENNYKKHKLELNDFQINQRDKIITNSEKNVGVFSNSDTGNLHLPQNQQHKNLKNTKMDAQNKIVLNTNQKSKNPSLSMKNNVYISEPQNSKLVEKEKFNKKYFSRKDDNLYYHKLGSHLVDYNNNKKKNNENPYKKEENNEKLSKSNQDNTGNDGKEVPYPEEIINLEKSDILKERVSSTLKKPLRKLKKSEEDNEDLDYSKFSKLKNQKSLINNKNSMTDNQNNKMHSYIDRKSNAQRLKYKRLNLIHSGKTNGLGNDAKEFQNKHIISENDKKIKALPDAITSNTPKYSNVKSISLKNTNKYYAITSKHFEPESSLKQKLDFLNGNLKHSTKSENEENKSPKSKIMKIENLNKSLRKKWNALDSKNDNNKVSNKKDFLNKFYDIDSKQFRNNLESINYLKETNNEINDHLFRKPTKSDKSNALNLVDMNVKDDEKEPDESVESNGNQPSHSEQQPDILHKQANTDDLNNETRKQISVSFMLHKDKANTEYVKENKKFNYEVTKSKGNFISEKHRKVNEIKTATDLDLDEYNNKEYLRDGDNYNDYLGTERFKSRDLKMYVNSINQLTTMVSTFASSSNDKEVNLARNSQSINTSTFKNIKKKSNENLERNIIQNITTEIDKNKEKVSSNRKTISDFKTSLESQDDTSTKGSTSNRGNVVINQNTVTENIREHAKRSINEAEVAYLNNYDNRDNLLSNYQSHFVTQGSRWHEPIFFDNTKSIRRREDSSKRMLENISSNHLVDEAVSETINNMNVLSKTSNDSEEDYTTFSALLSTRDKSEKTNQKTSERQNDFRKHLPTKHNVNVTSTIEEKDILESVHRKLANKLLSSVFSMVQSDADLRSYLGPGLYRKLDDKNSLKNKGLDAYKNSENMNDIKHTEDMLKQVMAMLNKLVEEQVRIRTCSSPRVETSLFLQWMLHKDIENHPEKYLEVGGMPLPLVTNNLTDFNSPKQEPYLFLTEELEQVLPESNVSSADLEKKIQLIKQLIDEYDHLSDRDKIQVHNVKQYLYKHLDLLGKLLDNNNLSNSKTSTPDITNSTNDKEKRDRNAEEYFSLGNNRKTKRISHNKYNGKNIKRSKFKRTSNVLRNPLQKNLTVRHYSNNIGLGEVTETSTGSQYLMPSKVFESSISGDRGIKASLMRVPRRGHRINKPLSNDPNIIRNRKPNKESKKNKTLSLISMKPSDEETTSRISEQYRKLVKRAALYRRKREIQNLLVSGKSLNDIVSLLHDNEYEDLLNLPNIFELPEMYRNKRDNRNNVYHHKTHTVTDKPTSALNV